MSTNALILIVGGFIVTLIFVSTKFLLGYINELTEILSKYVEKERKIEKDLITIINDLADEQDNN